MIFHQPLPGCIRVADGFYSGDPILGPQNNFLAYSNLGQIEAESSHNPDPAIFGAEPPHGWCYYYQKADLARQFAEWDKVLQLYKQAASHGLSPSQGGEYLPLLEAYARSGQWSQAYQLSTKIMGMTQELNGNVCAKWTSYAVLPGMDAGLATKLHSELACP